MYEPLLGETEGIERMMFVIGLNRTAALAIANTVYLVARSILRPDKLMKSGWNISITGYFAGEKTHQFDPPSI